MTKTDDSLAVVIPELGYALKRLPECYVIMRWDEGGVNQRGRAAGAERKPHWVSMDKYPGSLAYGLYCIRELAMADKLKDASAKEALTLINQIISLIGERLENG